MADGSPVGVFTDNGADQKLSACDIPVVSRTVLLSIIRCKTASICQKLPYIYTHVVSKKNLMWLIGTEEP